MRPLALVPLGLIVAGGVLVGLSVLAGGASLAIVVIVPVVYGRSLEFLAGVLLLLAGLFTLPLAGQDTEDVGPAETERDGAGESTHVGGLVLVGPVPILFGRWTGVSTRARLALALIGAALLAMAIVVFALAVR